MDNINITTGKKPWQKPNFWILDTYIEGGGGANVNESTARTDINGAPAQSGNPGIGVYKDGHFIDPHSVNWTAAHS
jgi:hypothetical protein